jgi:hypothetical protein
LAASRPKNAPLRVEVPGPEDDKLRFGRVGVIALVGFVIGILWPRLAGVKLVPSTPAPEEQAALPPAPSAAPAPKTSPPPAIKPQPVEPPPPRRDPADWLKVEGPHVTSCRQKGGKRLRECDKVDVDQIVRPQLLALAECPAGKDARGTLSLGMELDFSSGKATDLIKGKSTTLSADTAEGLLECAKKGFASMAFGSAPHKTPFYTVFYRIEFLPPKSSGASSDAPADAGTETAEATVVNGRATVIWEVAILRSTPSRDGNIVARLMRGTRLVVSGRQADWYKVKYDAKGNEAWVFRTAIGL